tara:strand:- start:3176 stop:3586 length:411 start_codon:yes stop_codon:yes gene_type:complete
LKGLYFLILILSFTAIDLSSSFDNDIRIKSDTIEFLEKNNQINFINNVEINSDFVNISADLAVYDDIKDVISILGKPSTIKSSKKDTSFNGKAEEIMFFNDEKIHLIGNASMKYENISISSNIIIFNPRTGKISSE